MREEEGAVLIQCMRGNSKLHVGQCTRDRKNDGRRRENMKVGRKPAAPMKARTIGAHAAGEVGTNRGVYKRHRVGYI